jgi:UDP-N-acetylmuramate dehydrogenase
MTIKESVSLKALNTFGLDVYAKYFAQIANEDDLREVLSSRVLSGQAHLILGGGSNILFKGDFDGLVLKNELLGKEIVFEDDKEAIVKIGAGENWHEFVLWALDKGFYGAENLSLIPGTVGASPIQNIGAYGVELKDIFQSLEAIHVETLKKEFFLKKDCDFGYRSSIFKEKYSNQYFITSISFALKKENNVNISYGEVGKVLEEMQLQVITPKAVSDAIIQIRSSKLPNPAIVGNAGSFFKNPEIDQAHFQRLQAKYPNIVYYALNDNSFKIPAGWLIDQCGWRGKVVGNTGTYKNQALVIVNHGGASGEEIITLTKKIEQSVLDKYDIQLVREVNIV